METLLYLIWNSNITALICPWFIKVKLNSNLLIAIFLNINYFIHYIYQIIQFTSLNNQSRRLEKEILHDRKNYESVHINKCGLRMTMCCGIPAWGRVEFSKCIYCYLWMQGTSGCCGLHRCYVGDFFMGTLCFLTYGFCFVGQLLDVIYFWHINCID